MGAETGALCRSPRGDGPDGAAVAAAPAVCSAAAATVAAIATAAAGNAAADSYRIALRAPYMHFLASTHAHTCVASSLLSARAAAGDARSRRFTRCALGLHHNSFRFEQSSGQAGFNLQDIGALLWGCAGEAPSPSYQVASHIECELARRRGQVFQLCRVKKDLEIVFWFWRIPKRSGP